MSLLDKTIPMASEWRTEDKELAKLQLVLDRLLNDRRTIRVLEAGCGSARRVALGQDAYIVGIDISDEQLRKNRMLDERILGDVQTYDLPSCQFDAIICWDVLEHLPRPELCLENFLQGLREGGVIILAVPNVFSVKGLVTRFTPHRFHVWVYRFLYGNRAAGTPGCAPFRTFMRRSIATSSLSRFASERNLAVEYLSTYESEKQRMLRYRYGLVRARWTMLKLAAKALSLGRIDAELTDCLMVLRKRAANTA